MAFVPQDEDEETLEAVLSFVNEFDVGHDGLQLGNGQAGPASVERSPPDNLVRSQPQTQLSREEKASRRAEANERKRLLRQAGVYADPNRARKARSKEITALRVQFEKLQIQVKDLRRERDRREQAAQSLGVLVSAHQVPSLWKKLAARQRQRREESQETNTRLKLAVEHHQKLADAMNSALYRRASQLAGEYGSFVDPALVNAHAVQALDVSSNYNTFWPLLHQLDAAYRDMDTIFTSSSLAAMAVAPGDVHTREFADGKHRYLEFFSLNVLPFKFQDTAEATWAYFRGVEKHFGYGNLYEKAAKDFGVPLTVVEDFTKEIYSHSARADVRSQQVIRRFIEAERDAVIRVNRAEPVEIKHKLLSKAAYHLQGYAVTKRSPLSTPEHELSILQLCTLVYFDQEELEGVCDPASVRALTEFLVVHTAQNTRAHCQQIENALADQALATHMH